MSLELEGTLVRWLVFHVMDSVLFNAYLFLKGELTVIPVAVEVSCTLTPEGAVRRQAIFCTPKSYETFTSDRLIFAVVVVVLSECYV